MKWALLIIACNVFTMHAQDEIDDPESLQSNLDAFEYHQLHPMILSQVRVNELTSLPGISRKLAVEILSSAKQCNQCNSISDLLEKLTIKPDTLAQRILEECTIVHPEGLLFKGHYRLRVNLSAPNVRGIRSEQYKGSSAAYMHRLFFNVNDVKSAVVHTKQLGEPFQYGLLQGSISFAVDSFHVILGDYRIEHGLGSLFSPMIIIKDYLRPTISVGHWTSSIKPNTSSLDYISFRGIAVDRIFEIGKSFFLGKIFASFKKRSASLNDSGYISGFPINGYYRTDNEIDNYNVAQETRFGSTFEFSNEMQKIGLAGLYVHYDKNVINTSSIAFHDQDNFLCSASHQIALNNISISSEAIVDKYCAKGFHTSLLYADDSFNLAIAYRYFSEKLISPFGKTIGRFGVPHNDKGFYSACEFNISKDIKIATAIDCYSSLQSSSNNSIPMRGMKTMISVSSLFREKALAFRCIHEKRFADYISSSYRFRGELIIHSSQYHSTIRAEYARIQEHETESGLGFSFILKSNSKNSSFYYALQASMANATSFSTALYFSEISLPGELHIQPLYSFVNALNVMGGYKTKTHDISLILRYLNKPREQNLGSGLQEINGNAMLNCALQWDWKF